MTAKQKLFLIRFFLIIGITIGLLVFYHYYYHEIDTVITTGEAYGYKIGQHKSDVFLDIKQRHKEGKIKWLSADVNPQESIELYGIDIYQPHLPVKVKSFFSEWDTWELHGISEQSNDYLILSFTTDEPKIDMILWVIGYSQTQQVDKWPVANQYELQIREGMTYEETYSILCKLAQKDRYQTIKLKAKNYRKIMLFNENSFQLIKQWNIWIMPKNFTPYNDFIRLTFANDCLSQIRRCKKYNPYPF